MIEKRELIYKGSNYCVESTITIKRKKYTVRFIGNDSSATLKNQKNGKQKVITCEVKIYNFDYKVQSLFELTKKGLNIGGRFIHIPIVGYHNSMNKFDIGRVRAYEIYGGYFTEFHILDISADKKCVFVDFKHYNQKTQTPPMWVNINTEYLIVDTITPR